MNKKNKLNLANKVFNWQNVLILGGLNGGISLYFIFKNVYDSTGCSLVHIECNKKNAVYL